MPTPCPPSHHPQIVASVCPELHGLFNVKLATLLMLVGGVTRQDAGGAHIRGEVHMLLVGDPGTGQPSCRWALCCPLLGICMTGRQAWDSIPLQLHCLAADAAPLPLTCCLPALRMRAAVYRSVGVQARASSKSMWLSWPPAPSSPAAAPPPPRASPRRRCTTARGGRWRRGRWCWQTAGCA